MKARLKKAKGPNTHSTWWCYIVAVLLILIYLLPIYIMLNLSFRTIQDVGSKLSLPAMWNFQNYIDVFKSGDLWLGFKNSIVLVVETVVLEIVFSALAAYGLARSNGKIAESIRNINMGIMMIPGVALLVGTYGLMVKFHMTNTLYGLALLSAAGGIPGTIGAFSAAPTSNLAEKTAKILEDTPYTVDYFYNICGTEDEIAYDSAAAAAKNLPALCDKLKESDNFIWQELKGMHDFHIWYLGFFNFAQIAFK